MQNIFFFSFGAGCLALFTKVQQNKTSGEKKEHKTEQCKYSLEGIVKNSERYEVLLYLQANKLAW